MTEHSFYMERAIQLARRGTGFTNPNPLVGAVIVKDSRIIGEGWHAWYGDLHAERNALKHCTEDPAGATIYVTLEPCLMCAGLMVNARIDRCVFGAADPKGGALGTLYDVSHDPRLNHEFEVTPGVLADEAASQLRAFFRARREARKAAKAQTGAEAITDPTEQPAS